VLGSKIGLEALQDLISGAKRVDLGDMTRPVTGARKDALESLLPKAAKAGDDWGWKGGKPGEVTGGDYMRMRGTIGPDSAPASDNLKLWRKMDAQIARAVKSGKLPEIAGTPTWMRRFAEAEEADIPREWTARVVKAYSSISPFSQRELFKSVDKSPQPFLSQISEALRPMTNDQRSTFLALLPEWTESLDDLAEAVRTL